jgi:uncharacterized protein YndB with AHSA1/START domain
MLAFIEKVEAGCTARFERHLEHSVQEVWSYLTENNKLQSWFPELIVDDLREGGMIKFDMQDGTFEELKILELETNSILEYTWGEDVVRFELTKEPEGCLLVLIEKINTITNHTPRDLAGWHVCLDFIKALLNGNSLESRKTEWEKWHTEYIQEIDKVKISNQKDVKENK